MAENLKIRVLVRPKEGILDPQGEAVRGALPALGFGGVETVHVGRLLGVGGEGGGGLRGGSSRASCRDGGRERGRGRRDVPAAAHEPDYRGVRVGGGLVRIGVTVFPGSNCDRDALYAVERMGAEPVGLWRAEADPAGGE